MLCDRRRCAAVNGHYTGLFNVPLNAQYFSSGLIAKSNQCYGIFYVIFTFKPKYIIYYV